MKMSTSMLSRMD